ncbi:hypothetical protein MMC20_000265 [Loxospora ochrophaea]|nr:hypothetical protein [Loxospora ochrophaea]
MFSVIVPSRPVITDIANVAPNQFAFRFPSAPSFSHLVVFLLPGNDLPVEAAAGVYIQFPGNPEFKLLGALSHDKQSAIFKVNNSEKLQAGGSYTTSGTLDDGAMVDDEPAMSTSGASAAGEITLGISVEPASTIQAQLMSLKARTGEPATSTALTLAKKEPSTKLLAQRIIKNAFDYLSSFATGQGGKEMIPLKSFQDWWTKFQSRLESDPGFLERVGDG